MFRQITTPFSNWDTFKLGMMDEFGKWITEPTNEYENILCVLKRTLESSNTGEENLPTFLIAAILLKEQLEDQYEMIEATEAVAHLFGKLEPIYYPNGFPQVSPKSKYTMNHEALDLEEGAYLINSPFYPFVVPLIYSNDDIRQIYGNTGVYSVCSLMGNYYFTESNLVQIS